MGLHIQPEAFDATATAGLSPVEQLEALRSFVTGREAMYRHAIDDAEFVRRQNADLLVANNGYLDRARKAEAASDALQLVVDAQKVALRSALAERDSFADHNTILKGAIDKLIADPPPFDIVADVARFHEITGTEDATLPSIPEQRVQDLSWKLVDEEVNRELRPAQLAGDLTKMADGIIDSIWVLVVMARRYGLPFWKIWAEVRKANHSKADPITGKVKRREDGKILKPDGWQSPDPAIARIIEEESARAS